MKKIIFTLLICFPVLFAAQTQTDFANLGSTDSGGAGFKTVANNPNIVVSNVMTNDGTEMYTSTHSSFIIKAIGNTVETFTFSAMEIRAFVSTNVEASSTVTFKDINGTAIQTMTLNADKNLGTSLTSLTGFFDNGTATPINNVAEILFDLKTPVQHYTMNYNYVNITLGDYALPVELNLFTASLENNKVKLNWHTATEVNNYGFDIERQNSVSSSQKSEQKWEKIGFIEGAGNSNSPKEYSYTDESNQNGTVQYRLKQIDIDGKFEYSNIAEVTINTLPNKFELRQNYPNPFNPSTAIRYSVPAVDALSSAEVHVSLKVYDILGNEVATLVNENQEAGNYEIEFNASNLATGMYIYQLNTGSLKLVKKMLLVK